jgi:NADH:ubiquinone oxidoreductase subunit B-like Fe-S oxidoreductase
MIVAGTLTNKMAPALRKAEALDVVARHRHLHHLDRAIGKSELHPHGFLVATADNLIAWVRTGSLNWYAH